MAKIGLLYESKKFIFRNVYFYILSFSILFLEYLLTVYLHVPYRILLITIYDHSFLPGCKRERDGSEY